MWRLRSCLAGAAVLLASASACVPALASPAWSRIDFEASKFLLTATTVVRLDTLLPARAAQQLVEVPGRVATGVPGGATLRIESRSRVAGAVSLVTVWLDPGSMQLLQRERRDGASEGRYKLLRAVEGGVQESQRRADAVTRDRTPADWPLKRQRFQPLPPVAYTDALALLMLAGTVEGGERVRAGPLVLADGRLVRVVLEALGESGLVIPHTRRRGATEWRVEGVTRCRRVRLSAADAAAAGDGFRLLGLAGAIVIDVDAESGAPLRLSGRDERLGALTVTARLVELAP